MTYIWKSCSFFSTISPCLLIFQLYFWKCVHFFFLFIFAALFFFTINPSAFFKWPRYSLVRNTTESMIFVLPMFVFRWKRGNEKEEGASRKEGATRWRIRSCVFFFVPRPPPHNQLDADRKTGRGYTRADSSRWSLATQWRGEGTQRSEKCGMWSQPRYYGTGKKRKHK